MRSLLRFLPVVAWLVPLAASAQRLPSEERKPPLTRKENWGMSLGVELMTVRYEPTRCLGIVDNRPSELAPCTGLEYAHSTQGVGVGLNVGLVFLHHFIFGAEVWSVGFGGDRRFTAENPPVDFRSETTNSLAASAYGGLISSPLGGNSAKVGRKLWLGAIVGKSHWSGQRRLSAPSCEGCAYVPLRMGHPSFVEPFAMFGGGDRHGGGGLKLAYRHHFGGFEALHGAVTLGLFFAFGKL